MRAGSAWAAILEVLGVYVAGQLVMFGLATVLGIELRNPLAGLTAQISSPDLLAATRDLGVLLLLQYAGWLLLVVPIGTAAIASGGWRRTSGMVPPSSALPPSSPSRTASI